MMRRLWADRGRVLEMLLRRTAHVAGVLTVFALLAVPVWLVISPETAVAVFLLSILCTAYAELRKRQGKPTRASRKSGWHGLVMFAVVLALVGTEHWYTAISLSLLDQLLPVRRSRYVDFGRFTACVWETHPNPELPIFALCWVWHNERAVPAKRSGLQVVIGRTGAGVFALMPRSEWPEYKQNRDARRARQKERD